MLEGITPSLDFTPAVLTIGEPQFETPSFIQDTLKNSTNLLNKYPKTAGEEFLKSAQLEFIHKRFGLELSRDCIIPTFGTREVLFNFPQFFLHDIPNPVMAYTNPFYQIYEGAARAARAKVIHLNLLRENNFLPQWRPRDLEEAHLVILNFPNNPTAANMSLEELGEWVKLALKYNFVLINDECYSEIYTQQKPASLLEASVHVGNRDFKNILVVNSISKRSSAPSLRSGFIAGDSEILAEYLKYRTYLGVACPLPLQVAASEAWRDEVHVSASRQVYKENQKLASQILGIKESASTFYVWLHVEDALRFTQKLYEKKNVKVLPGEFLGREGMGCAYVRIALVQDSETTKEILHRIRDFMNEEGRA